LLALFQAPPPAVEPVRSGCSTGDEQIASASPADRVQVEMARAGDQQTCYRIVLTKAGQAPVTGYVLGEELPAVAVFVHRREKVSEETAKLEARLAQAAQVMKPGSADPARPPDPLVSTQFEEFSGRDSMGKPISLSGLRGRVTVVSFWSPKNGPNQSELASIMPLYYKFQKNGLAAVGVSMDPNPNHILEALDDFSPNFPQMADQAGMARRYNVDPRAGKTFVLDASHRIVAAGPMGPEMENTIRRLLDVPERQFASTPAPNPRN
jgi:peroxiredoxin